MHNPLGSLWHGALATLDMLSKAKVPHFTLRICLVCAWLVVSATGCARPKVFADWKRGADFGPGKTFAVTASEELPDNLDERQRRLVTLVNSVIERELTQKGYTKAPVESAQLIVNFHVVRRPRQEVTVRETECYARNQGEPPPGTRWENAMLACEESLIAEYEEDTLIIDVYDAGNQQLIWQGWTSRRIPPKDSSETPALVERATSDILTRFPPG